MRKLIQVFACMLVLASCPYKALAIGNSVQRIRNVYSTTNVTTGAWVQLTAATTDVVSTAEIFDSSGQVMQLATGAAGSEVAIPLYVTPGGNGQIRLLIGKGVRLSVRAVTATASVGELDINLYN